MKNRREFLEEAATGAVLLGLRRGSKLGLGRHAGPARSAGKSKVVIARDPALHGARRRSLTKSGCSTLLDRAIAALHRPRQARRGLEAALCPVRQSHRPQDQRPRRQRNLNARSAGPGHCRAVAAGRRQARQHPGLGPNARDLEACGLTINTDPSRVRCFGSDVAGFEDEPVHVGQRQRQAFQDPHPRVRHGDQPAHPQGSRACRASPSP